MVSKRQHLSQESSENRGDRKQEICSKAIHIFRHYGYRKTTIEDIGKACGLGKAALYHYYSSKEEIFAAVVQVECDRLLNEMRKAIKAVDDPRAKLIAAVKTRFRFIRELILGTPIESEIEELVPQAHALRQEYFVKEVKMVADILTEGIRGGVFRKINVAQVAPIIMAAIHGIDLHFTELSLNHSSDQEIEKVFELLFEGICI